MWLHVPPAGSDAGRPRDAYEVPAMSGSGTNGSPQALPEHERADEGASADGSPQDAPPDGAQPSLTRRAALAAAIGGVAAVAAQAVGMANPESAAAWDGDSLMMGRTATGPHTAGVDVWSSATAFRAESAGGDGLMGVSNGTSKSGVYGLTENRRGFAIYGRQYSTTTEGALAAPTDGVYGTVRRDGQIGVRGMAQAAGAAGVRGENPLTHTLGVLGGAAGVQAEVDEGATEADALSVFGPVRLSRSGLIGIPVGAISGSKAFPFLHKWTSVIATLQTANAGTQIASASIDPTMEHVVVYLTTPSPYGVTVAFLLIETTP
jgi:hypothetical protein